MTVSVRKQSLILKVLSTVVVVAAVMLACWSAARAGMNRWSSEGPEGATVNAIVISPVDDDVIYVLQGGVLYTSTDGGAHWLETGEGLAGSIHAIAADRFDPNIAYAATSHGAFKSSDCGATWTPILQGLPHTYVELLVADRLNNLYLVNSQNADSATEIYRSTNGGATWDLLCPDPAYTQHPLAVPGRLVIDPVNSAVLYRSRGGFAYRSQNGGQTWAQVGQSMTGWPN